MISTNRLIGTIERFSEYLSISSTGVSGYLGANLSISNVPIDSKVEPKSLQSQPHAPKILVLAYSFSFSPESPLMTLESSSVWASKPKSYPIVFLQILLISNTLLSVSFYIIWKPLSTVKSQISTFFASMSYRSSYTFQYPYKNQQWRIR